MRPRARRNWSTALVTSRTVIWVAPATVMRDRSPTPSSAVDEGLVRTESSAPSWSPLATGAQPPEPGRALDRAVHGEHLHRPWRAGAGTSRPRLAAVAGRHRLVDQPVEDEPREQGAARRDGDHPKRKREAAPPHVASRAPAGSSMENSVIAQGCRRGASFRQELQRHRRRPGPCAAPCRDRARSPCPGLGGEERLEDALAKRRRDAAAVVRRRAAAGARARPATTQPHLDASVVRRCPRPRRARSRRRLVKAWRSADGAPSTTGRSSGTTTAKRGPSARVRKHSRFAARRTTGAASKGNVSSGASCMSVRNVSRTSSSRASSLTIELPVVQLGQAARQDARARRCRRGPDAHDGLAHLVDEPGREQGRVVEDASVRWRGGRS